MVFTRLLVILGLTVFSVAASADEQQRIHLDVDKLQNSEQLQPVDGITSTGQPDADDLALVAEAGYVAVVDLRGTDEDRGIDEAAVLERLGLTYISLPLSSPDAINFENAAKLEEILAGIEGPVLLHCGSGNRVGALLALRHSQGGASDEDAVSYGRAAGMTGLEPVVRARLGEKD